MQQIDNAQLGLVIGGIGESGPPNRMTPAMSNGGGQSGSPNVVNNFVPTMGPGWSGSGSGVPSSSIPLHNSHGTMLPRQLP